MHSMGAVKTRHMARQMGRSRVRDWGEMASGLRAIMPQRGTMRVVSMILAPRMLPTDREPCFLRMEATVVISSGREVPMAMTVTLMIPSGTPKRAARALPWSTRSPGADDDTQGAKSEFEEVCGDLVFGGRWAVMGGKDLPLGGSDVLVEKQRTDEEQQKNSQRGEEAFKRASIKHPYSRDHQKGFGSVFLSAEGKRQEQGAQTEDKT